MKEGFLRSREFAIALVLIGVVVAGAAYAFSTTLNPETLHEASSCAKTPPTGAAAPPSTDTGVDRSAFRAERIVTYTIPAEAIRNGTAVACTSYGDVAIRASPDDVARVIFTIRADSDAASAVAETGVAAYARKVGDTVEILAWQTSHASVKTFFTEETASVAVTLELPGTPTWKLDVSTKYGDVTVSEIPLGNSTIDTSYGDVAVADVQALGSITIDTRYGDVDYHALRVATGDLLVDSSYGDLTVRFPKQPDAGYDVTAETSYGNAEVSVGDTERYEANKDQDTIRARTEGYDGKPVRLSVVATTRYGDVSVATR